ncbi:MAG TPA: nuclear transport factor 2 family protein [Solirubrobacteraceae bacterium]
MSSAEDFNAAIESLLLVYAEDVVCYPAPGWVEEQVCHGHEGIRRLGAVWSENWDDVTMQIHDVRDLSRRVLVLAEFAGRDRDSGEPVRVPFGVLNSDLRTDGKVGEARFFLGWDAALDYVANGA